MQVARRDDLVSRGADGGEFEKDRAGVVLGAGESGELDVLVGALEREGQGLAGILEDQRAGGGGWSGRGRLLLRERQ
jgi:hypothetical protein